jgi:hypothetical protein
MMNKIYRYIKYSIVCFFIRVFKIKKDKKHIPYGYYCYVPDIERNKKEPLLSEYWIIPCKHYKYISENNRACTYLGYIGNDMLLWDQVKICGINCPKDDEE